MFSTSPRYSLHSFSFSNRECATISAIPPAPSSAIIASTKKKENQKTATFYATPSGVNGKKYLNRSAVEGNQRLAIKIHKKSQPSTNMDTSFTKHETSFTANTNLIEEPLVIAKRPKSSQSGSYPLKIQPIKGKVVGLKKHKHNHGNSQTEDVILAKAEAGELNGSFQKPMSSLGFAAKGVEIVIRNSKAQPKSSPFIKKKGKSEGEPDAFPRVMLDNLQMRKDLSKPPLPDDVLCVYALP